MFIDVDMECVRNAMNPENIYTIIADARAELRNSVNDKDYFIAIKAQEHAKRAIIVAAVQGHTVFLFGPTGHGKTMLVKAGASLGVPVKEAHLCPCGNYSHPIKTCRCTSAKIRSHWKKLRPTIEAADICAEVSTVPATMLLSKTNGTTLANAKDQLQRAKLPPQITQVDLSEPSKRILKQAIIELALSPKSVTKILDVARSITALMGNTNIDESSLCEAIQYSNERVLNKLL